MIRDVLLLVSGLFLLVALTALGVEVNLGLLTPNPLLPMVIYLGMVPDASLARGATLSFLLGLIFDSFCGSAMGLMTFVHVATYLVARGAGYRLLMRGRVSQVLITALTAVIGAATAVALRSIFRVNASFEVQNLRHLIVAVIAPGLTTGAVAPFVFQLARRVDTLRRRDEAAALS